MELAGHKSIQMTMRYARLSPNQKKVAVEILSIKIDTIWTPSHHGDNLTVDSSINLPYENLNFWAISSAGEHSPHTGGAAGSIPALPNMRINIKRVLKYSSQKSGDRFPPLNRWRTSNPCIANKF